MFQPEPEDQGPDSEMGTEWSGSLDLSQYSQVGLQCILLLHNYKIHIFNICIWHYFLMVAVEWCYSFFPFVLYIICHKGYNILMLCLSHTYCTFRYVMFNMLRGPRALPSGAITLYASSSRPPHIPIYCIIRLCSLSLL